MDSREQLIMVLDCKATNRVKSRVADRIARGVCLGQHDDGTECETATHTPTGDRLPATRRGLCSKCAHRWRSLRLQMPASQRAVYDSKLIRAGRLLSERGESEYKKKSVFDRFAAG